MDYSKVFVRFYPEFSWSCGDTYESIIWKDKTTEKQQKMN